MDIKAWMVIAALAMAGSAAAQDPAAPAAAPTTASRSHIPLITNPDWLHKPGPDDFSQYWPSGASSTGIATIECNVTAEGRLTGCVVRAEEPVGQGFGAAALKMAPKFQMKPQALDGKPVGGGLFTTTIRFVYDGQSPPPSWVRHPTEAEILAVWPEKARGVLGQAHLNCDVNSKGLPVHCRVHDEAPSGKGFGVAALKLTSMIQLTPKAQTGVLIPIAFVPPSGRQNGLAEFGTSLSALTNAPWRTAPLAADVAAAWPKAAPAELPEAKVRLSCSFTPEGTVSPCSVLSEEPAGFGFGAAALALTSRFHMLASADASAQSKARLILPITFENPALASQAPAHLAKPNWVTFIDQGRMTELYPAKASQARVKTGRGVVACVVAPGGGLTSCTVQSEDPAGLGFGESAIQVLASFTANLWTDDGHPVDGATVLVPVRMNEAEPDPAPASSGAEQGPPKPGEHRP